jgi:transcriptional regulator with XRE-family HTH domain
MTRANETIPPRIGGFMKNNSMLFLASKLQRYLVSNKISIARLAERLEVPKRNLIDLSKGINPRDIVLLKRLANLLNLRLSDIHLER